MPDNASNTKTADQILKEVQKERRGKLKLFFGAAPGVGKTYAMLQEVQEKRAQGLDVLVGWVDTHARKDTEAMLAGLEVLPRKTIVHRGFKYQEFDIDEVLKRRPGLVVVDELAHSNAPGSRHPKRWQDVEELLDAGINVYTALNVQHLESLNNVVERMIGVTVNETVPDRLFDEANEVRLVDLPPADLIARLKAGKVYLRQTIEAALGSFFKQGNLLALRELSLKRMAERADAETNARRVLSQTPDLTTEGIVLWLGNASGAEELVRSCSRLSATQQRNWHVVWYDDGTAGEKRRLEMMHCLALAEELGAATQVLSGFEEERAVCDYARTHGASTIAVSKAYMNFWRRRRLMNEAEDLRILEMTALPTETEKDTVQTTGLFAITERDGWWQSCVVTAVVALILMWLEPYIKPANAVMVFLIPTLIISMRYGRAPGVLTALLSSAAFIVLFVEPPFSFAVDDPSYLIVPFVMLLVAAGTGTLFARLRRISDQANDRTAHMRMLFTLSRELGKSLMVEEVAEILEKHAFSDLGAKIELWSSGGTVSDVKRLTANIKNVDRAIVLWCVEHGDEAGRGTHTLPYSPYLYLPLRGQMRVHGVIVFSVDEPDRWLDPEMRRVATAVADLAALALERLHYIDVSQKTLVEMESDRFRHALIQELGDELQVPLSDLTEGAEALSAKLSVQNSPEAAEGRKLLSDVRRMSRLTGNLLEMSRLQSSGFELEAKKTPIAELFEESLDEIAPSQRQQFHIVTNIAKDCPAEISVDPALIRRLLVNLLDNAVKYCSAGCTIELSAEAAAGNVLISVSDNGPGLPGGDVNRLFDPFKRGVKTGNGAVAGVGLGLAISRTIARVHGAQLIGKNNADGPGCTFTLILPPPEEEEAEEEAKEKETEKDGKPLVTAPAEVAADKA